MIPEVAESWQAQSPALDREERFLCASPLRAVFGADLSMLTGDMLGRALALADIASWDMWLWCSRSYVLSVLGCGMNSVLLLYAGDEGVESWKATGERPTGALYTGNSHPQSAFSHLLIAISNIHDPTRFVICNLSLCPL